MPAWIRVQASVVAGVAVVWVFGAGASRADTRASADGLDVRVDFASGTVVTARGTAMRSIPIPIERSRLDKEKTSVEVVPVGEGRSVVHVRVPDVGRKDLAFEAILAAGVEAPIFAGLTGYTRGSEGDRAGDVVLFYDRDERSKFVILAESREDTRICGQAVTPLAARGLDPRSMELRGATLHRIEKAARDAAAPIVAEARASDARAPLARLLAATGGSSPRAAALTDGDPATAWTEARPGDGHGEFVTMRAPAEVPLRSLVVTPIAAPSAATPIKDATVAPRTFFIATDHQLFHVTMPEDAVNKPGTSYVVPFPAPVQTTCVALVLDEAYGRGKAAREMDVTLGEVDATTKFDADGATLDDVAKALPGPRSDEAAGILRRAGEGGLAAVLKAYPSLDAKGRALAVDVASSTGTCGGASGELLTRALTDRETEVKRRALGRIERCGKAAADALVAAVDSDDEARRSAAAPLLATIAPSVALEPLVRQIGKGTPETRHAVRAAFARVATVSSRGALLGLLGGDGAARGGARLDLLRALGPKLAELRPESDAAIAEILRASPDMPTRYLLAQPLAQLARTADATSGELTRLAELARRDPEWPVRARAVEVSAGIAPLAATILAATTDGEPRVREAAFHAIASSGLVAAEPSAESALAKDEWSFVRVAAADALGSLSPDAGGAALARALGDGSVRVRVAALSALGHEHATGHASAIRERLDDPKEDTDVRALAAKTLGAICASSATDRLTSLARLAESPMNDADDRVGMAAIEALGALHPPDLEKRLAPLRAKNVRPVVRRAVEQAMSDPGACR